FNSANQKSAKIKKVRLVPEPIITNRIFEPDTAGKFRLSSWWHLIKFETKSIVKSPVYIIIMGIGFIVLIVGFFQLTDAYGTTRYPTTYNVTRSIMDSYLIFFYGFIAFYTGVLVWKERDAKINEIQDATPILHGMLFTSKLVAIFLSVLVVMLASIGLGIIAQALYGYTNFEIGLYFKELVLIQMSGILFLVVISLLFHYLINNRYIAWFAFIMFVVINPFIWYLLEIDTNMVSFGSTPNTTYSDMNGYGPFVPGLSWFTLYWALFSVLLCWVISAFFIRGKEDDFKSRWKNAKYQMKGKRASIAISFVLFVLCASFVFYNTQVLNTYDSGSETEKLMEQYEREFKKFEGIAQPRYYNFDFHIDLVPENRSLKATFTAWARNVSTTAISDLHFTLPTSTDSVSMTIPNSRLKRNASKLFYRIYALDKPLQPGDSIQIKVAISKVNEGFENEVSFTGLTQNGTFFNSDDLLPKFGYQNAYEISDKNKR
ncbi:MAG: hypothetical protein EOP06_18790, partial [Proteobacteria bacterium]